MVPTNNVTSKVMLAFINIGVIVGMVLAYRSYSVDKLSLLAIGGVSLLVLNGMFLIVRTEPDLPPGRLR